MISAEKNPTDPCYESLCASLGRLATLDVAVLQNWLSKMIMGPPQACDVSINCVFTVISSTLSILLFIKCSTSDILKPMPCSGFPPSWKNFGHGKSWKISKIPKVMENY